jgi:uncharacterized protein (DUF433 family)
MQKLSHNMALYSYCCVEDILMMTLVIETRPIPLESREDGAILVAGTRIPLDTVIHAFRNGDSVEEIIEQYDTLRIADVYAIIGYYLDHQEEVDGYLRRRQVDADEFRRTLEAQFPSHGLRERLLARRQKDAQAGR